MIVHEKSRSLLLKAEDPFAVRELIPNSRIIESGEYNLAVRHDLGATRILRNLGYAAPSPIVSYYNWPGLHKPFDHQYAMAEFATMHQRFFNLSEMGVGKTYSTLWAADWLMREGKTHKALIVAPLSILERVWKSDIFTVLMHRTCVVVHGSRQKRLDALELDVDFYILNHDGCSNKEVQDIVRKRPDIDLIIVDEGSMFRNHQTDKWKGLSRMLRDDMRLWWLTGTPCPTSPADVWAQAKLVSPNRVSKYYGGFMAATMTKVSEFKWVPKDDAYQTAFSAMQPAIRLRKKDCLTLPPITTVSWQASLTKEQLVAFDNMKKEMQAELNANVTVTAVNAADKLGKLRQILCGVVKNADGSYTSIPHKPRTKLVIDAIQQASAKVLVIVPFKGIITSLESELSKVTTLGLLNGDVSIGRRNAIIKDFKETANPHTLLCHPKVMSHGLNLTEADTLVFYAPIFSNDEFRQVIERFNRTGQKRKMTIIRIAGHPLEWSIYQLLDSRDFTQASVLSLYKSILKTH